MLVTELPIVTDVKLEHPLNALAPMLVTDFRIITDIKLELFGTCPEGIAVATVDM